MRWLHVFNASGELIARGPIKDTETIDDLQKDHINEVLFVVEERLSPDEVYSTGQEIVYKPVKPSEFHAFDYDTKRWIDPRTLPERQELVRTAIKASRDQRKDGGTFVAGKWFHSDAPSRIQQLALVIMGAGVPPVQWKAMDGSFVTMSQSIAMGIFAATATLDTTLFANAEAHIEAVNVSDAPETYDFSTGWPAHYIA